MDLKKKFPNIEEYHVTIIKRKEDNGEWDLKINV